MTSIDADALETALRAANLEIYQRIGSEIVLAERVRVHMMDSGVRIRAGEKLEVRFVTRCQRSDFPSEAGDGLYARVRAATGPEATAHGFAEAHAEHVEVKDPMNDAKVLDIWHEITWTREVDDIDAAIEHARWAIGVEKYVTG